MHFPDKATTYILSLHISWATDINMVANRVCPRLLVWDARKKKGFELYYKEEMPTRKMKVEIVNWSSVFNGKQLIHTPKAHDARAF